MFNFIVQYSEELFLLFGIFFFTLLGKPQTAEKLKKKRLKRIAKLEKKTSKDLVKVQRQVDSLEELKRED